MTLKVEVGFGYSVTDTVTWTDITQYVDVVGGVSISRGASDEVSQIEPGTATLTLDNSDGRFTPGLASSPYYPNVRKNVPIRISVVVGATTYTRFWGMVNQWPTQWAGLYATAQITCTDLFKWLARQPQLQPLLSEEILTQQPVAYYPLTETEGTAAGDLAGTGATALEVQQMGSGGTLEFGSGTGPSATGTGAVLFTPSSASAGKYLLGSMGSGAENATTAAWLYTEAWFATSTTGRVIYGMSSQDAVHQIVFSLESGTGKLRVQWTSVGGAVADFGSSVAATANLADGAVHHLVYDEDNGTIYIDGALAGTVAVESMFRMRNLYVGGYTDGRLWSGSISHIALYATDPFMSGDDLAPHYTAGATGYSGEDADIRIARLASYAGVSTVTVTGTAFDPTASQGQGGSTALAMMQTVAATESAKLSASRATAGLVLQSRDVRYNPTPALTLEYADLETESVRFADDDQKMVNTVLGSRPGGATQRVVDSASRDAYGPYEETLDILKTTDNAVLDAAHWTVSRYADPPPELREVPVEAYSHPSYETLLGFDISTAATVTGLPAQAPASSVTVFVEGYTETIQNRRHLIEFHTSRSYNDTVWILNDPVYSVLDTTTRLAY